MSERALVVMGKLPRPGRVKTRLTPALSPEAAAALYAAFLQDVLQMVDRAAARLGCAHLFACALEAGESIDEARALCPAGWTVCAQRGAGLGERIEAARADARAERVVILGSDSPTMPEARLDEAFAALADHAAVFGPTEDGGYYLIGLCGPQPALLDRIPWSTERVMAETRARAAEHGLAIAELAVGYDIDHVEDLARAAADAAASGAEATAAALARHAPSD